MSLRFAVTVLALLFGVSPSSAGPAPEGARLPVERAVAFLAREVPRWPAENQCYSCHNNGDAARALYQAMRHRYSVPGEALRSTTDWLRRPEKWDLNAGSGEFDDRTLARIQFAGALLSSREAGLVDDRGALHRAAKLVAEAQNPDGSWHLDASSSLGSPATYGRFLATWAARRVLRGGDSAAFETAITRADRWLRHVEVKTVLDAAAVTLGLESSTDTEAVAQRQRCLEILAQGRAPSGGWGAYLSSPPEPFDTAVVLLALSGLSGKPDLTEPALPETELMSAIATGRAFLLERQMRDGSWPETTRPPGQRSYAQYISTSGWATLALLATESEAR